MPSGLDREYIKAVIVTYNNSDTISCCIQSLEKASKHYKIHIAIVDNASTDNTLSIVESLSSGIQIIRSTKNLGYGYGNNIAIKAMLSGGIEYAALLILSPDVTLLPACVDELASALLISSEVGGVSPNVVEDENKMSTPAVIKPLHGGGFLPSHTKDVIEVDRLHGCCMLVKPELFRRIGLFDEAYFLYWEEIDLCVRASRAGYKLLICNSVTVPHRLGKAERPHRIYYMWRNQTYFAFKNFGMINGGIFWVRRLISNLKEILVFLLARRLDLIAAGIQGLLAGISGERGRSSNRYGVT